MKRRNNHKLAIAAISIWWLSKIAGSAKAMRYGYAAQRDEQNGFPYTAAIEWRKAAELFAPKTRAAEYCWRQWERIMHLPRRLAEPVSVSPIVAFPVAATPMVEPVMNQISFANAA
jgi:hypothetical protein